MQVDPNKRLVYEKVVEYEMLPLFKGLADHFGKLSGARIEIVNSMNNRVDVYEYGRVVNGTCKIKPETGY